MNTPEISRSELVRAMVKVGKLLSGPEPLAERMTGLCATTAELLRCDQVTIQQLVSDTHYAGAFQHGLPEPTATHFPHFPVPRTKSIIAEIEACDSYLLYNNASRDPVLGRAARIARVEGVVIVPFTFPDGEPLGYLTAGYRDNKATVTTDEAELATGLAAMAQTTMLRHIERQRRREVSQAMLEVADSERRRLSRDIHDDPLQRILGLRIGLEGFRQHVEQPDMLDCIDSFIDQCRSASSSLREVMLRTHPNASELADLHEVLNAMIRRQDGGTPLTLRFGDDRSGESPIYLVPALNRIAEQAARNTIRHARASVLSVALTDKNGGTLLTITDDGVGFDPANIDRTRLGLVSMRERTELLDGTFAIDSVPGTGTVVSAWFPHTDTTPTTQSAR